MIKKLKKIFFSKLLIFFSCVSFVMLILTMACLGSMVFLLFRLGIIRPQASPIFPILFSMLFSVLTGTAISSIVAKRIFAPILQLRKTMSLVAQGDFSHKVDEHSNIEEISFLLEDFNQMIEELKSIETLRNDFISSVSHEFKTPLSVIRGYVQLLQDPNLTEDQREMYTGQILEATQNLSQLTGNILQLNKLENHVLGLESNEFQLDEQIRKAIVFLQPKWEKKEIEIQVDIPYAIYRGNEELLFHVWLNIVENAIKYTEDKGTIFVKLIQTDKYILCSIQDTGIGIDDEHLVHIFDKFYQVDNSRSSRGNGLGLALVSRIIELHEGKIKVYSQKSRGTKVDVQLPLLEKQKY